MSIYNITGGDRASLDMGTDRSVEPSPWRPATTNALSMLELGPVSLLEISSYEE